MSLEAIDLVLVSRDETRVLAHALAPELEPGGVLLLVGELGAGKTTLTTYLVEALGGRHPVTSPTFTLCHLYDTTPPIAHVDCWRLAGESELADLGLEEILDEGGALVVEWGERARTLFGADALEIELVAGAADEVERRATIRACGAGRARLPRLRARLAASGLALREPAGEVKGR